MAHLPRLVIGMVSGEGHPPITDTDKMDPQGMTVIAKRGKPHLSSQFIGTSHDPGPQKVASRKGNGTPYFREILVGEIL